MRDNTRGRAMLPAVICSPECTTARLMGVPRVAIEIDLADRSTWPASDEQTPRLPREFV